MSKGVEQAQTRLPSSPVPQRLAKMPKQPNSVDLIRHRKYERCVVCEDRPAITSNVLWIKKLQEGEPVKTEAVFTKWWTCLKCEEGRK